MQRIESFCVNHDTIKKGMYISRIDGDVVTYDIRMCIPNGGIYLENAAIHTFEHLFATYARNTEFSNQIIYIGPMGCRTGFYFLVRNTISIIKQYKFLNKLLHLYPILKVRFPVVPNRSVGTIKNTIYKVLKK